MRQTSITVVDLTNISLSHGEGRRLDIAVAFEPLRMGGQLYAASPEDLDTRLDISRPSGGYAFRLRFAIELVGPCMRCLEPAATDLQIDAREADHQGSGDEELRSPYVLDGELDLGRWAHDATALEIPTQVLCRADCAGLCPGCGESLNGADPETHRHDSGADRRWAKLDELKLE
jgi:uncharacterized protein